MVYSNSSTNYRLYLRRRGHTAATSQPAPEDRAAFSLCQRPQENDGHRFHAGAQFARLHVFGHGEGSPGDTEGHGK